MDHAYDLKPLLERVLAFIKSETLLYVSENFCHAHCSYGRHSTSYRGVVVQRFLITVEIINKKSCYSTGRVKLFIETFRALGVARGHSVTN